MNIEGIHISVDGLRINSEISSILDKYGIKTYADLERELFNKGEILNNYFLRTAYFEFKDSIQKQSDGEKVYKKYLKLVDKRETLGLAIVDIDKMVKVTDLPLLVSHPKLVLNAMRPYEKFNADKLLDQLNNYNVANLKERMMRTITMNGEPIPWLISLGTHIGEVKYNQIKASLMFYDSYIETLLEKYPDQADPFYYMHDEKLLLVRDKRKEIFEYLNATGYEFVFGKVSSVMNVLDAKIPSTQAKKRLFDIEGVIANYVTIDEAMDITSPKVLSKFIVPYGKR